MFNTPPLFQTAPAGNPAADVGILFIDKLFTKVAQALSAVIFEPTIIALSKVDVLLHAPPKIEEYSDDAVLFPPPLTVEQ